MIHPQPRGEIRVKRRSRTDVLCSAQASSLAEFAISLPLLVVLVVGIFDFGGAFNQKQELNTAVREGARFGASQPTNDLVAGSAPPSINAIRYLVDTYLLNSNINDCGLGASGLVSNSGPPWTYTAQTDCPSPGLTLTIYKDPEFGAPNPTPTCGLPTSAGTYGFPNPLQKSPYVACTKVLISYPYQWHFNSVIQVLVPGSTIALTQIQTNATVPNMN